jgi:hypothetical protein
MPAHGGGKRQQPFPCLTTLPLRLILYTYESRPPDRYRMAGPWYSLPPTDAKIRMYTSRLVYPLPTGLERTFPGPKKIVVKNWNKHLTASLPPTYAPETSVPISQNCIQCTPHGEFCPYRRVRNVRSHFKKK